MRDKGGMDMIPKMICNSCGKEICPCMGAPVAEYLHVAKEWGYFSRKDGMRQEWNLCESCYDRLLESFQVPASAQEVTELV